jgi:serine/threonine protein kinase
VPDIGSGPSAGGPDLVGRTLAHYRITAAIGAGGMGLVYRATDTKLGRDVALKILPVAMASSPEMVDRFRREARAVAALNHSHIVTIHSVEEVDGITFLTMELVDGQSLDRLIEQGPMDIERILDVAAALADALAAAHDVGIIHRDLKPVNVMVVRTGGINVLDFGLARFQRPESEAADAGALATVTFVRSFDLRIEGLASFQPLNGGLQCLQPLIGVTLGREDRCVTEQVAHLCERNLQAQGTRARSLQACNASESSAAAMSNLWTTSKKTLPPRRATAYPVRQ